MTPTAAGSKVAAVTVYQAGMRPELRDLPANRGRSTNQSPSAKAGGAALSQGKTQLIHGRNRKPQLKSPTRRGQYKIDTANQKDDYFAPINEAGQTQTGSSGFGAGRNADLSGRPRIE